MEATREPRPSKHLIRFNDLRSDEGTDFEIVPTPEERGEIAEFLKISALRKVRFAGSIRPLGKEDWRLDASIGATAVQPCVVTLEPVTTRIDERVERKYIKDLPEPDADEVEMPEDETVEPIPSHLDLHDLMIEALALALPQFPRKEGVELGEVQFSEPGVTPMSDADARPFAGLSSLREKLEMGKKED